jgi:hypothetical protein
MAKPRAPLISTALGVLVGLAPRGSLLRLDGRHLALGLITTWLVGMGRYWDDPEARLLQHVGLGSVIYVFVLTTFLWLLLAPLRPANWSWRRLLTYVALTSPPAALYAIPVERWTDVRTAADVNIQSLAVVALWRIALLVVYLHRVARFSWFKTAVATLFPMTLIVILLAMLNLEQAVFSIMGGFRDPTVKDRVYAFLVGLAMLSMLLAAPLGLAYLVLVAGAKWRRKE